MKAWNRWLEEDRNNDSKPIRPELLMSEIEKFQQMTQYFQLMSVLQQYGVHDIYNSVTTINLSRHLG